MDNDGLVGIVENNPSYLRWKSPKDERVLEAMRQVDRIDFLPDIKGSFLSVNPELVLSMYETALGILDDGEEGPERELIKSIEQVNESSEPYYLPVGGNTRVNLCFLDYFMRMYELAKSVLGEDGEKHESGKELMDAIEEIGQTSGTYKMSIKDLAYNDIPLYIGSGQTCSQPSMVAFMADILELEPRMRVLEIGSGCGYSAAVTAHLIGESGLLYTIEKIPELVQLASSNLANNFGKGVEQRVQVIEGDGSIGLESKAPFDRIYLTAEVDPESFDVSILARQLNPEGGILVFPEKAISSAGEKSGPFSSSLVKQKYKNGQLVGEPEKFKGVGFVSLKGKNA